LHVSNEHCTPLIVGNDPIKNDCAQGQSLNDNLRPLADSLLAVLGLVAIVYGYWTINFYPCWIKGVAILIAGIGIFACGINGLLSWGAGIL